MSEPTDLNKFKKQRRRARGRADTMCRRGFHKWRDDAQKQFDVKAGKLVSRQVCEHCGATRVRVS
ncbi:MAG: hypothetical protein AAF529_09215 [Pseudomonadota bacterium]